MILELVYIIAPKERWKETQKGNQLQISKPVEYYSVLTPEEESGDEVSTVRDMNRMWELSEHLVQSFPRVDNLPQGSQRLFVVTIKVEKARKDSGVYEIDYHRYDGCPIHVSVDGMELYREIRKIMKKACRAVMSSGGKTEWHAGRTKSKNKKRK